MCDEREELCQAHEDFLQTLKEYLGIRGVYDHGDVDDVAKAIKDPDSLNQYIISGHFHKNFYTNYHALWTLFCGEKSIPMPNKFYVYDIACGPYTATISLLNYLKNQESLAGKAFMFALCDRPNCIRNNGTITEDSWLLSQLCNVNAGDSLSFSPPIDLDLFQQSMQLSFLNTFMLNSIQENLWENHLGMLSFNPTAITHFGYSIHFMEIPFHRKL